MIEGMIRLLRVFIVIGMVSSAPAIASEDPGMPELDVVEREVRELHRFFQDWYRGKLEDEAFQRFSGVMGEGFMIILPDARVLPRQTIVDAVRSQKGSDAQAELWIENVRLVHSEAEFLVATYEEWQGRAGNDARGRLSTVVFTRDEDAPNGLAWRHVHETWLPEGD
ncbi:MAG: hypothetical protein WD397_15770 [Wenzhouxiangellaceae bacterium]